MAHRLLANRLQSHPHGRHCCLSSSSLLLSQTRPLWAPSCLSHMPRRAVTSIVGMVPEGLQLRVPWGHVAGLHWPGKGPNVLAIHGWLDNANSFVPLLKPRGTPTQQHDSSVLSKGVFGDDKDAKGADSATPDRCHDEQGKLLQRMNVVAIDLPGHGRSSHKARGSSYLMVDWVRDVHWVIKALGWERFHLVGHSMGAGVATLYASCFPNKVQSLSLLEGAVPVQGRSSAAREDLRKAVLSWEALDAKKQNEAASPHGISFERAVEKLMEANTHVAEHSARLLLRRGLRPVPSEHTPHKQQQQHQQQMYVFSRDLALRQISGARLSFEQTQAFMKGVRCPTCVVLAKNGVKYQIEDTRKHLHTLRRHAAYFEYHMIAGSHHVHMNEPEPVRAIWLTFLHKVATNIDFDPADVDPTPSKL